MITATGSDVGKTTFTCALLSALMARGLGLASFKSGPDYIDPMFHTRCIGVKGRNLDLFLQGEETVRGLLARHAGADFSLLEGAMGYYDGIALTDTASSYALARATKTPAVLVVDCKGMGLSAAAQVLGYLRFRPESGIAGVLLNRVSPGFYPRIKGAIQGETGLPVLGFLPNLPEFSLASRHLGLIPAEEVEGLKETLHGLGQALEKTVEVERLLALAATAPPLVGSVPTGEKPADSPPLRIGIARDAAFSFYYPENLELLEELGAALIPVSPLSDPALPQGLDGLLLGGGYPEVFAESLSQNASFRRSLHGALTAGLPCLAECGGYLYLHETLEDTDGTPHPMVGFFTGRGLRGERLGHFGYCTLKSPVDGPYWQAGADLPAHEFHYWQSSLPGTLFTAQKPQSPLRWGSGNLLGNTWGGFAHLHYYGAPRVPEEFLARCQSYRKEVAR